VLRPIEQRLKLHLVAICGHQAMVCEPFAQVPAKMTTSSCS
jgi:hypothetical protein